MELREIISFHQVASLRSISKAASKLGFGQPTVTVHIRSLEEEFGTVLFDRIMRPIQLTSEGAHLLELVRPIIDAVDKLKTQMDSPEQISSFVVGAYPDLAMHHLPRSFQSYRRGYPNVRIQLRTTPHSALMESVKSGEIDVAICSRPSPGEVALDFMELFPYNLTLLTAPEHQLLQQQSVQLHDIAAYPLIMLAPGSITRHRVEQALKEIGVKPDIVLEIDTTQTLKHYVEFGLGVSICSDFTLHNEDHLKLGVIPLNHLFPSAEIGVCTLRGKFLGRALQAFIDTLREDLSDTSEMG